jgi:5-methylcytosine-specific restriction endonuclease McrA
VIFLRSNDALVRHDQPRSRSGRSCGNSLSGHRQSNQLRLEPERDMKKSYSELLRDPRWQKRRLEILSKTEFTCLSCGDNETELHVHHLLYEKGKAPWDYPDYLLLPLCSACHKSTDLVQKDITRLMAEFPVEFLHELHNALKSVLSPRNYGTHPYERWDKWIGQAYPAKKRKAARAG